MRIVSALIFTICCLTLNAQLVNISLDEYSKKYSDFWQGDQRQLSINLIKEYHVGERDTAHFMTFSLFNKDVESTYCMSYNYALGLGLNELKHISISSSTQRISMIDFVPFVRCLNKSFVMINDSKVKNTMIACNTGDFIFGAEKKNETTFYFSNQGNIFRMPQNDFVDLIKMFKKSMKMVGAEL